MASLFNFRSSGEHRFPSSWWLQTPVDRPERRIFLLKFIEFFALKLAKRCFVQLLSTSVAFAAAGNRNNEYWCRISLVSKNCRHLASLRAQSLFCQIRYGPICIGASEKLQRASNQVRTWIVSFLKHQKEMWRCQNPEDGLDFGVTWASG